MRDIRCNNKRSVSQRTSSAAAAFSLTPFTAQIPTSTPEREGEKKDTDTEREEVKKNPRMLADKNAAGLKAVALEFVPLSPPVWREKRKFTLQLQPNFSPDLMPRVLA